MSIGIDTSKERLIARGRCLVCGHDVKKNNPRQHKYWCCKEHRRLYRHQKDYYFNHPANLEALKELP